MNSMFQADKYWVFIIILLLTCCSPSQREKAPDQEYDEYEIPDPSASESMNGPKTHVIEITQMKFVPETININKGDKVKWVNNDIVEHDVTELLSKAWASSKLPAGASWEMVFTKSEMYYCNLHVVMKGKVVVDGTEIAMAELAPGITICR